MIYILYNDVVYVYLLRIEAGKKVAIPDTTTSNIIFI